jgi:hypothetical protein
MAFERLQPREPSESAVRLAVAAVEDSGRPLDPDAGDPDTSPTSLGLPPMEEDPPRLQHQNVCPHCGAPLRQNGS